MNKEPIGLYIFRFILGFGLFAFMAMLYWSSTLIEDNVKDLQAELGQLKNDVFSLHSEMDKMRGDILQAILENQKSVPDSAMDSVSYPVITKQAAPLLSLQSRPHIDPELPNLLNEDPFYALTLPKLLGPHFQRKGTFRNAILGKPDNLHPFSNWLHIATWTGQCTVSVAKMQLGKYETLSPDMAIKLEERKNGDSGKIEYWVHLRDGVFWHPLRQDFFSEGVELAPHFLRKHQVTAYDFKFYLDALMNPYVQEGQAVALRNFYNNIEELEVIDPLTFIVRWKSIDVKEPNQITPKIKYVATQLTGGLRPLASFVYQYFPNGKKIINDDTYRTNSVWGQTFSQHWSKNTIVSCGPWAFDGLSERQIKFKRNPDYYFPNAVLVEEAEVHFKDTPDAVWQDFQANKLDSYEARPNQLLDLEEFLTSSQYLAQQKAGAEVKRLDYLSRTFSYIGWNETKPFFKSKKVRQALTMAIDRNRIIKQNLNGMGIEITGPIFRYSPNYDPSITPWPFDPIQARRQLEEEGWYDRNGDGVLDNIIDNKPIPFEFTLTYYVKNPTSKAVCEYVSTALKEVGIVCNLNGVDIADLSAAFDNKSFDALNLAWALSTPPEDPKQLWYSAGIQERGSSNAISFSNPEIDAIIENLEYERNHEKRIALYHRFHAIIHEEAPYTFLYTPKTVFLYRNYLQGVFIPAERQDLIPGANVAEPDSSTFWLNTR